MGSEQSIKKRTSEEMPFTHPLIINQRIFHFQPTSEIEKKEDNLIQIASQEDNDNDNSAIQMESDNSDSRMISNIISGTEETETNPSIYHNMDDDKTDHDNVGYVASDEKELEEAREFEEDLREECKDLLEECRDLLEACEDRISSQTEQVSDPLMHHSSSFQTQPEDKRDENQHRIETDAQNDDNDNDEACTSSVLVSNLTLRTAEGEIKPAQRNDDDKTLIAKQQTNRINLNASYITSTSSQESALNHIDEGGYDASSDTNLVRNAYRNIREPGITTYSVGDNRLRISRNKPSNIHSVLPRLQKMFGAPYNITTSSHNKWHKDIKIHHRPLNVKVNEITTDARCVSLCEETGYMAIAHQRRLFVFMPQSGSKMVLKAQYRISHSIIRGTRIRLISIDSQNLQIYLFRPLTFSIGVYNVNVHANKDRISFYKEIFKQCFVDVQIKDIIVTKELLIVLFGRWLGVYTLYPQLEWQHERAWNKDVKAKAYSMEMRIYDEIADLQWKSSMRSVKNYVHIHYKDRLFAIHPANPTFDVLEVASNISRAETSFAISKRYGTFFINKEQVLQSNLYCHNKWNFVQNKICSTVYDGAFGWFGRCNCIQLNSVFYDENFGISGRLLVGVTAYVHMTKKKLFYQWFNWSELNAATACVQMQESKYPFDLIITIFEMLYGVDIMRDYPFNQNTVERNDATGRYSDTKLQQMKKRDTKQMRGKGYNNNNNSNYYSGNRRGYNNNNNNNNYYSGNRNRRAYNNNDNNNDNNNYYGGNRNKQRYGRRQGYGNRNYNNYGYKGGRQRY